MPCKCGHHKDSHDPDAAQYDEPVCSEMVAVDFGGISGAAPCLCVGYEEAIPA